MKNYSITTFILSNQISNEQSLPICKLILERTGYEIIYESNLEEKDSAFLLQGKYYPYINYKTILVCLDLIPWKKENKNPNIRKAELENTISDNYRTSWAIATTLLFLNESLKNSNKNIIEFSKEIEHLSPVMDTLQSTNFLKYKIPDFDLFFKKLLIKVDHFKFPYKVIKEETDYGCNNKIALVEKDNKEYICKIFKPNKLQYLKNEITIYEKFVSEDFIPELIDYNENWILIKYYANSKKINHRLNRIGKLPISVAKDIFINLKKLWDEGFIHMDFHPGNIIFHGNRLIFIDFEYIYMMKSKNKSFIKSPGLIFSDRVKYDAPLHHINYDLFWRKLVGFKLFELVYYPKFIMIIIRLPLFTIYWTNKIIKKCMKILQ